MNQSEAVKDGAVYGLVFLLLMFVTLYIVFTAFLLPVPFILFTKKYGWRPGITLFAILAAVCTLLLTYVSLPFVVLIASGGIAIGAALHSERSPYEALARGSAGFAIGIGVLYVITQFVFQINWVEEVNLMIEDSYSTSAQLFEAFDMELDEEAVEQAQAQAQSLVYLIPTGMIIFSVVFAFLSQWISYKWLNRTAKQKHRFPKFRHLSFPISIIWYYLIAIILTWIFTDPSDTLYLAGVNLYSMLGLLLVVQGLSFVFFYVHHKKWPRFIPFGVILILVFFPIFLLYPLRILGIIDLGFQLRSRLANNSK